MRLFLLYPIHLQLPRALRGITVAIVRARAMQARIERYRMRD